MSQHSRMYGSRWRKAREGFLRKHPLCKHCQDEGLYTPATVVDHSIPHRGDMELFWKRELWVPVCKFHHDSYKQRLEKRGVVDFGCDENGSPNDPSHHWYR